MVFLIAATTFTLLKLSGKIFIFTAVLEVVLHATNLDVLINISPTTKHFQFLNHNFDMVYFQEL